MSVHAHVTGDMLAAKTALALEQHGRVALTVEDEAAPDEFEAGANCFGVVELPAGTRQ